MKQLFVKDTSWMPGPIAATTLHGKAALALGVQPVLGVFVPFTVITGAASPAGTVSVTVPEVQTWNVPGTTTQ